MDKNNIELNNEDVIDDHHVNIIKRKKVPVIKGPLSLH